MLVSSSNRWSLLCISMFCGLRPHAAERLRVNETVVARHLDGTVFGTPDLNVELPNFYMPHPLRQPGGDITCCCKRTTAAECLYSFVKYFGSKLCCKLREGPCATGLSRYKKWDPEARWTDIAPQGAVAFYSSGSVRIPPDTTTRHVGDLGLKDYREQLADFIVTAHSFEGSLTLIDPHSVVLLLGEENRVFEPSTGELVPLLSFTHAVVAPWPFSKSEFKDTMTPDELEEASRKVDAAFRELSSAAGDVL